MGSNSESLGLDVHMIDFQSGGSVAGESAGSGTLPGLILIEAQENTIRIVYENKPHGAFKPSDRRKCGMCWPCWSKRVSLGASCADTVTERMLI